MNVLGLLSLSKVFLFFFLILKEPHGNVSFLRNTCFFRLVIGSCIQSTLLFPKLGYSYTVTGRHRHPRCKHLSRMVLSFYKLFYFLPTQTCLKKGTVIKDLLRYIIDKCILNVT